MNTRDRPTLDEITSAMMEAGADVLREKGDFSPSWELARDVYIAMARQAIVYSQAKRASR